MNRTIVDIHALQTVPPSNVNRDDTGSPKTAWYGGVRRSRVSSQAWKRATRTDFGAYLDGDDLGVRTKRVVELVADEVTRQDSDLKDQSMEIATKVLTAAGIKLGKPRKGDLEESGYLLFLSHLQVAALAGEGIAVTRADGLETLDKERSRIQPLIKGKNSIDLSLFGRMVADVTDLNVDASAQVAHALSIHAVDNEYDYFTAVDDHKRADVEEDAGAGMIGTVEFNSSTLYRYATVDVDLLERNLGNSDATRRGVEAFLRSFLTSMPTGKQNTFANRTLPDAIVVMIREDQPVSLVGAFEEPVQTMSVGGTIRAGAEHLAAYAKDLENAYENGPVAAWVVGVGDGAQPLDALGERVSIDSMIERVGGTVVARLNGQK